MATGIFAYERGEYPDEYDSTLVVELFGPLVNPEFRGIVVPRVVVANLEKVRPGVIRAVLKEFASGFVAPSNVSADSQGSLYIADYAGNQIYRVSWEGTTD